MMRNTSINFGYDAINRPNALTQDMAGTAYDVIPSCAEADSDLGFPNVGNSDSMLFFIWRT
jgi:hypothetical protein